MGFEKLKDDLTNVSVVDKNHAEQIIDMVQEVGKWGKWNEAVKQFQDNLLADDAIKQKSKTALEEYIKTINLNKLGDFFKEGGEQELSSDEIGALACYNLLTVDGSRWLMTDVRAEPFKKNISELMLPLSKDDPSVVKTTPETTPEGTPQGTPAATPEATAGETPETTPEGTPGAWPDTNTDGAVDDNNATTKEENDTSKPMDSNIFERNLQVWSMDDIIAGLKTMKENSTDVIIEGEHFYFDSKQLKEQGFNPFDHNTNHEVTNPQALLDAYHDKKITGLSVSDLVWDLVKNGKTLVKYGGNLLTAPDETQKQWLDSLLSEDTQDASSTLSEKEKGLFMDEEQIGETFKKTKDHNEELALEKSIDEQPAVKVIWWLIENTQSRPVGWIYKVQIGSWENKKFIYATEENFEAFLKPYQKNEKNATSKKKEIKNEGEKDTAETNNMAVDDVKLFFEKNETITPERLTDLWLTIESGGNNKTVILKDTQGQNAMSIDMKTNTLNLILPGQKNGTAVDLAGADILPVLYKATRLTSTYRQLLGARDANKAEKKSRVEINHQLAFFENQAKHFITWNEFDSHATGPIEQEKIWKSFGDKQENLNFSTCTIDQFIYNPAKRLVEYNPSKEDNLTNDQQIESTFKDFSS